LTKAAGGPTAIVGAMEEEVARLRAAIVAPRAARSGPFEWVAGELEGVPVLLAECGIGKVNASALTQALLEAGAVRIVFTGVAGAVDPRLRVGDVVIGVDAVQHDVDVTGLGYAPGEVPGSGRVWASDPELCEAAAAAAEELGDGGVMRGRVASGDVFVTDQALVERLRSEFGATCAEMEGGAVAQVCARWGVPFVIIRSISDNADHSAQVDFRSFTKVAARRSEAVVRGLLRRLPAA
jgi:adenosylhomocysteine nucleosidase